MERFRYLNLVTAVDPKLTLKGGFKTAKNGNFFQS